MRRGVLNIVVVKDPYFWASSIRKNPYQACIDKSDLSAPFVYQGRSLRGVADYWCVVRGRARQPGVAGWAGWRSRRARGRGRRGRRMGP